MSKIIVLKPEEKVNFYCDSLFTGEDFLPGKGFLLSLKGKHLLGVRLQENKPVSSHLHGETTWSWPCETTILPGLIDCHLHLALHARARGSCPAVPLEHFDEHFDSLLQSGITAARDGGDAHFQGWRGALYSSRLRARDMPAPYIVSTGRAFFKEGYYGSLLGKGISHLAEAYSALEKFAGKGIKQAKILFSGIVSFNSLGKVGSPSFSRAEACSLVAKAHSLGLKVMAHASSDKAVQMALDAGADSIEHGYFVKSNTLARMAERQIPWIPTLAPVALQLQQKTFFSRQQLNVISATWERQSLGVLQASKLGVPLAVGTDAGAPGVAAGESFLKELQLLAGAGLSPLQVLRSATYEGAKVLGEQKELGLIKPGRKACLMVVKGNPLYNLDCLANPLLVLLP